MRPATKAEVASSPYQYYDLFIYLSPSYGLLVNVPFVLQPYNSTLMQAVAYAFHSSARILITCAIIASSNLFVTMELPSLFPFRAYEKSISCEKPVTSLE